MLAEQARAGANKDMLKEHREDIDFKCTADEVYSVFLDKHVSA